MRKCIFKTDPSVSIQLSLRPSTWTKCSAGNSAQAGRCAVNKSHLIDVLTPLLRQRSAASRNNRPLFPHRLPMCTKALMVTWIELTVTVQRALLIQHLSSEWFRVNEKKKKKRSHLHSHLFSSALSAHACLKKMSACLRMLPNINVFSPFWCSATDPICFQHQPLIGCHRPFDEEQRW